MNFTGEIRRELLKELPEGGSALTLLAAFLQTSGSVVFGPEGGFSFTSENEDVAEYLLTLTERLFHVSMTVEGAVRDPKHGRDKLTFSYFGERGGDYAAEIVDARESMPGTEDCAAAYLKGAFLGGGSCTLPRAGAKTGYHLEVHFRTGEDVELFIEALERMRLVASIVQRGEKYIAYSKSRESIGDFLSAIGATNALKKLENVATAREENNNRNRVENCTGSNADRSAVASVAQVVALEKMRASGMLDALPQPLREAGLARIEHPALSLSELAAVVGISKGGLNHRLRKLIQIYRGENS